MPIGIPKVFFRFIINSKKNFFDIYSSLFFKNILFLKKKLNNEIRGKTIAQLIYLRFKSEKKKKAIYINCIGGFIGCRLPLINCICIMAVSTINFGVSFSTAALVISRGQKGNRIGAKNAKFKIYQPRNKKKKREKNKKMRSLMVFFFSFFTKKNSISLITEMEKENIIIINQAKIYGLIDKIL